jgi:hypothetical protein
MHKKTEILCLGIIYLSLKKMDPAKGRQEKKEADLTFVLLSAIRTLCSFYIFEYTQSPNLTNFR